MVGKAKKSTHGKKAGAKALAKRRASKAPAPKKRVEIDETVSNLNIPTLMQVIAVLRKMTSP